jgi:hypothetical protein
MESKWGFYYFNLLNHAKSGFTFLAHFFASFSRPFVSKGPLGCQRQVPAVAFVPLGPFGLDMAVTIGGQGQNSGMVSSSQRIRKRRRKRRRRGEEEGKSAALDWTG